MPSSARLSLARSQSPPGTEWSSNPWDKRWRTWRQRNSCFPGSGVELWLVTRPEVISDRNQGLAPPAGKKRHCRPCNWNCTAAVISSTSGWSVHSVRDAHKDGPAYAQNDGEHGEEGRDPDQRDRLFVLRLGQGDADGEHDAF